MQIAGRARLAGARGARQPQGAALQSPCTLELWRCAMPPALGGCVRAHTSRAFRTSRPSRLTTARYTAV